MRPISIRMENINSFREAQTVDFDSLTSGENIFCISGDTGSGKSTIFVSMLLALYKGISRSGSTLDDFINLSEEKAVIELKFESDGEIYETRRVLRRKGNNDFTLKRNGEIIASGDAAFDGISEMIGLDVEQFTQVALLEQGRFGKFLDSKPADRTKTLQRILSLERLGGLHTVANKMLTEVKEKLNGIDLIIERNERDGKTKDSLKTKKAELKTLTEDVKKLVAEEAELRSKLLAEEGKRKLHEEIVRITRDLEKERRSAAENKVRLEKLIAKCSDPTAALATLAAKEQELKGIAEQAEKLGERLKKRKVELETSREKYKREKAKYDKLKAELDASLSSDIDSAVALILTYTKDGDKCPVCGGEIKSRSVSGGGAVDRADKERALAALEATLESVTAEGKRCHAEVAELEKQIAEEISPHGDVNKSLSELRMKKRETEETAKGIKDAETSLAQSEATVKTLIAQLSGKGKDDYDEDEGRKLSARHTEVSSVCAAKQKMLGMTETAIAEIEKAIAETEEYKKERKVFASRQKELDSLVKLFKSNGFANFVTEEYIKDFTVTASSTLSRLSGGNYTLEYRDNVFYIRDFLNGNKERKIKTLSGGETFLASLSIAISIMRYISAGKNFEFFFLDEGFGTLHDEAVETVVAALRELSKEVTVGLISHVDDLVSRISSRIHIVHATESRGSLIEVI